jgi:hypothetical protein
MVQLNESWLPLSENADHDTPVPTERTVQPGDAFEDNVLKRGFEIVKF